MDYGKFNLPFLVNVTSFLLEEENEVAVCSDVDMKDGRRSRIYIVGKDIYIKKFKKKVQRDQISIGHFSSVMFQAWLTFRKIYPKRQKKNEIKGC